MLGREQLEKRLEDPEYVNSWGINDDSLLDMAAAEIRQLAKKPGPFAFVGLTLSGHPPYGYPAQSCYDRRVWQRVSLALAWACWARRRTSARSAARDCGHGLAGAVGPRPTRSPRPRLRSRLLTSSRMT